MISSRGVSRCVVPASTSGTSASSTSTESASSISATSGFGRHQVVDVGDQLVAQHVEADLVDRGVGDVALVGGAPLVGGRLGGDPADGQAHRLEQRAHPFGVAPGEVVVDGDDVHAAARDGVPGGGDRAGQGLALAGGHLDDVARQHPQRAEQLNVERAQRRSRARRPRGRSRGTAGCPSTRRGLRGCSSFGGLLQLLVVEVGGLVVEVGRGAHLRPSSGPDPCRYWRRATSRIGCSSTT